MEDVLDETVSEEDLRVFIIRYYLHFLELF